MITIPELELELQHGTLGGVFSTMEGLMQKIYNNLSDDNSFAGDSYSLHHSEDPAVIEVIYV
jgi:zinc finger protein